MSAPKQPCRSACRSFVVCVALLVAAGCSGGTHLPSTSSALTLTADPDVVARGRYLAYGPAHCVSCHTPDGPATSVAPGEPPPLVGGFPFRFPGGTIHAPNLTPDPETGIGRRTDAELIRMMRHGIRADGSKAVPVMTYQDLSDEDLRALLSFLRAQPPVRNVVPERRLNVAGRLGMAVAVRPLRPDGKPPALSPAGAATVERGAYLVERVAQCAGCHTKRGFDGRLRGPRLAGGWKMPPDEGSDVVLVTPNLTPDPDTGVLAGWSEDQFVARFRAGRVVPQSHMPWNAYATMTDADLRAMYRYLRSLPPVRNDTGPAVRRDG